MGETQEIIGKHGFRLHRITIDTGWPKDMVYSTVLHELGHAMGLGHSTEPDSCMHESNTILEPSTADLARAKRALKHRKGKR